MAYTDYSQIFQGAAKQYPDVPPNVLSSIAWKESRYNPQAVGSSGEQGMMQFMPATAKGVGLGNPFDPQASIYAGANLLHQNLQATGGDMSKALMMYNGGTNQSRWNPAYASAVLSHAQQLGSMGNTDPSQGPYYTPAPSGDQAPMLPLPPARPLTSPNQGQNAASLGGLMQPQNLDAPPMQPAASLGALASSLPQGNIPQPSKFTAGNALGVLGDALMAYSGMKPQFGPFMQEQKVLGQQQNFEREKFQQELAMRMYAMTHPQDMMDGIAFANAPKEVQQAMVYRENALHPVVADVQRPDGSFIRQTVTRQLPPQVGEIQEGHRYLGGDPANPNSWQAVQ